LLLVFFGNDGNPIISIDTDNSDSGWTIESTNTGGTGVTGTVIWKIADADGDTLTLTLTGSSQISVAQTYRITNFDSSDPIKVTSAGGLGAQDADPPANTGDYSADDYLWIVSYSGDGYTSYATAAPADFTGLDITYIASAGSCSVNTAWRKYNINGAYDPGIFTKNAAEEWAAFTVIINPIQ